MCYRDISYATMHNGSVRCGPCKVETLKSTLPRLILGASGIPKRSSITPTVIKHTVQYIDPLFPLVVVRPPCTLRVFTHCGNIN